MAAPLVSPSRIRFRSYIPAEVTLREPGGASVQAAADLGILEHRKGLDNMGVSQPMEKDRRYDVVIIGGGPGGGTAAAYARRARAATHRLPPRLPGRQLR